MQSKNQRGVVDNENVHIDDVDENGFTINIDERKIYASFQKFNLFKRVRIEDLFDVSYLPDDVLHWEKADIDLYIDTFKHLEKNVKIFDAYPYGANIDRVMATNDGIHKTLKSMI